MRDPGSLALATVLLPAAAFLLLALVVPLRRAGRPAAYLSSLFAAGRLACAVRAWSISARGGFSLWTWPWIPMEAGRAHEPSASSRTPTPR
jgi:hypothetical protein